MKLLVFLLAMAAVPAIACDPADKVYSENGNQGYTVAAVYICSTTGEPSYKERSWICRTDLSEGTDREPVYVPLCPGAKSEYERLKERKGQQ